MSDDNTDSTKPAQEPGNTAERAGPKALIALLLLGVIIAVVALPGILSEEAAPPAVTSVSAEVTPAPPAETPDQEPALSPEALEDLRSAPTGNLTINPEPLLLESLPEEDGEMPDETPTTPMEDTQIAHDSPFSVGEALARYLLAMREDLNSEYVANCIRHRNRNGAGAECPNDVAVATDDYQQEQALVDELFAIISREGDYARISSRLERENATLAAILDDPDNPAAVQASTKLALNNGYLSYLNGNPSPAVSAFNTMNDFVNDYNRTIIAGPFQFRCEQRPCVYEYTGPEAE